MPPLARYPYLYVPGKSKEHFKTHANPTHLQNLA
jgi:hypothetical protein